MKIQLSIYSQAVLAPLSRGSSALSRPREGVCSAAGPSTGSCSTEDIAHVGPFPASCPLSAATVLPEAHLLCLWTAGRILDVAWSFLLDGFCSGSYMLSLWTVSWSLVTVFFLFFLVFQVCVCVCVSYITSLGALTPLLTCETVLISPFCYHRISVTQHA